MEDVFNGIQEESRCYAVPTWGLDILIVFPDEENEDDEEEKNDHET